MNHGDSCAVCFYAVTDNVGVMHCAHSHPEWQRSGAPAPGSFINWPIVQPTDWCGEGMSQSSQVPFSPSVQAPSAAMPVYMAPNPNPGGTQTHIVGAAVAQSILIRSGPGWITGITVNSVATGNATLTCYDGLDATGVVIAVIDISRSNPSPQTAAPWGYTTGFFVVVSNGSAGADITIVSHSA